MSAWFIQHMTCINQISQVNKTLPRFTKFNRDVMVWWFCKMFAEAAYLYFVLCCVTMLMNAVSLFI